MKLSICITTLNRATFIGATIESILSQLTDDCELVVLDAASVDGTEEVMRGYASCTDRLRYIRQDSNNGIDRDYDRAIEHARGTYCWLMTDDDLVKSSAVDKVLAALDGDISLLILNAEVMDLTMSSVLQRQCLTLDSNRSYDPNEIDRLFVDVGSYLRYVGGVVIARDVWLSRDRASYYGSLFIHVGVIFQRRLPGPAVVMAEPMISYRACNIRTFSRRLFEVMMISFPAVVWSLNVSNYAKRRVSSPEPWRKFLDLIVWRALGHYSVAEYRRLILPLLGPAREPLSPRVAALIPGVALNALFILYCSITAQPYRGQFYPDVLIPYLKQSRFYVLNRWTQMSVPGVVR